jgi:hypothetical protein
VRFICPLVTVCLALAFRVCGEGCGEVLGSLRCNTCTAQIGFSGVWPTGELGAEDDVCSWTLLGLQLDSLHARLLSAASMPCYNTTACIIWHQLQHRYMRHQGLLFLSPNARMNLNGQHTFAMPVHVLTMLLGCLHCNMYVINMPPGQLPLLAACKAAGTSANTDHIAMPYGCAVLKHVEHTGMSATWCQRTCPLQQTWVNFWQCASWN